MPLLPISKMQKRKYVPLWGLDGRDVVCDVASCRHVHPHPFPCYFLVRRGQKREAHSLAAGALGVSCVLSAGGRSWTGVRGHVPAAQPSVLASKVSELRGFLQRSSSPLSGFFSLVRPVALCRGQPQRWELLGPVSSRRASQPPENLLPWPFPDYKGCTLCLYPLPL